MAARVGLALIETRLERLESREQQMLAIVERLVAMLEGGPTPPPDKKPRRLRVVKGGRA